MWFNPHVPDDPVSDADDGDDRARPARSIRWIVAVGVAALVALSVAVVAIVSDASSSSTGGADAAPAFVDDTAAAGIDHAYTGGIEYFVGGGVAAFDCDGNGLADLFFAGGTDPAALYRNESPIGGALRFANVASPITDLTQVTGAYPIDIDSDGLMDLAVLRRGANVLLRGLGDCGFEDATAAARPRRRGQLDRRVQRHVGGIEPACPRWPSGTTSCPTPERAPTASSCAPRPPATSTRRPWRCPPGTARCRSCSATGAGRANAICACRTIGTTTPTARNSCGGSLPTRRRVPYTEADGWKPMQIWGMGIASQDVTGDGYPEVFLTSQADNKLQTLENGPEQPAYEDMALEAGVTAQRPYAGGDVLPSTAWHPEFEDVNNDGFVDLFVVEGQRRGAGRLRDPRPEQPADRPVGRHVRGGGRGGRASSATSGPAARPLVDLNLDGMLDLVVVNRESNPTLWRNVGRGDAEHAQPMGHWIAIDLEQPAPNVDAIGAWVEVRTGDRTIVREVTVGGGHAGGKNGWIHAGLGDATSADVRVQWPDGETGPWMTVDGDQFVTIDRGVERSRRRGSPEGSRVSTTVDDPA